MRKTEPSVPKSYDDIVRGTVPDPDSSQRPSARQEEQARDGFRALDADESMLAAAVGSAVAGEPGVEVEVDRDTVTLRGRVRDAASISRLEDAVNRVDGVGRVVNRLVVG